jgi:Na+/H+ antiporter NhaD/arsenite permease-like protein
VIPAVIIFVATYVVMAIGRLPGYRLDRAGAALLGAALMVAVGVLDLNEAFAAIDGETIALLLGMMIVVANLRLSGFFRLTNVWVIARAGHPLALLAAIVAVTGVLSAFLVNDAMSRHDTAGVGRRHAAEARSRALPPCRRDVFECR